MLKVEMKINVYNDYISLHNVFAIAKKEFRIQNYDESPPLRVFTWWIFSYFFHHTHFFLSQFQGQDFFL